MVAIEQGLSSERPRNWLSVRQAQPLPATRTSAHPSKESPTTRALPVRKAGGSRQGGWWRLVWCHERCHKHECEERRQQIAEAARETGGSLLCFKKANKFAMWLEQGQRPPFALLTDWREVKPCIQAAAAQKLQNRPAFTVVLCEQPRHYDRASQWAQTLDPETDPVHVCKDVSFLCAFLSDLLRGKASMHQSQLRSMEHAMQEVCEQEKLLELQTSSSIWNPPQTPPRLHTVSSSPSLTSVPSSIGYEAHDVGCIGFEVARKVLEEEPEPTSMALYGLVQSPSHESFDSPSYELYRKESFSEMEQGWMMMEPCSYRDYYGMQRLDGPILDATPHEKVVETGFPEPLFPRVYPQENPREVARMLREAMPDHYEE